VIEKLANGVRTEAVVVDRMSKESASVADSGIREVVIQYALIGDVERQRGPSCAIRIVPALDNAWRSPSS